MTINPHHRWRGELLVVTAVLLAFGCTDLRGEPARPAGVPAEAFWLGGPDGGVFVSLKRRDDPASTSYTGAIYYPNGSLWYRGAFILTPAGGQPIDPANRRQFAGWDGTQLLLPDGRALVATRAN